MKKTKKTQKIERSEPITTAEAAAHCRVSIPTFKRWIERGDVATYRTPGGHHRIPIEEFQRFLRQGGLPSYSVAPVTIPLLIVDDEAEMVRMLVEFFGRESGRFLVETATDGYEALIKVGAFRPAVVVLDVMMPRLDGVEVCRRLTGTRETEDIKIIGLTGNPSAVPALLEAGAHACLVKPVDLAELARTVDLLVSRARPTAAVGAP
jgi:excisionase family DNA binding protein